jgi:hypothetical protein
MTTENWSHPICERCWIEAEGEWELVRTDDGGHQQLARLRFPIHIKEPLIERCGWCGQPTIFGVYRMADPRAIAFPQQTREAL